MSRLHAPGLTAVSGWRDLQGMGVLDKTVLVFDEPFWDLNSDFITREAVDWSGRW